MKVQAIIPTAGMGTRMQGSVPKPLVKIKDKPIIVYSLKAMAHSSLIGDVILAANESTINELERIVRDYHLDNVSGIVVGGETRSDSVFNALKTVDTQTEVVLVHDGARPLISTDIINEAIVACNGADAVVVAVPAKSTIKIVDSETMIVKDTLDRSQLWEVQTPQVFKKDILIKAHQNKKNGFNPTDDAVLVENMGIPVKVLRGDYRNIKITTNEDLILAEAFLASGHL